MLPVNLVKEILLKYREPTKIADGEWALFLQNYIEEDDEDYVQPDETDEDTDDYTEYDTDEGSYVDMPEEDNDDADEMIIWRLRTVIVFRPLCCGYPGMSAAMKTKRRSKTAST